MPRLRSTSETLDATAARILVRAVVVGAALVLPAFPAPVQAQGVAKTSWGDPDIQGVWNYGTMTPVERPAQWAEIEVLSDAEAVEYEQRTIARRAQGLQTAGPDWWEPQNNVLRNRRTSLVVDPPDGRIPSLTADAQARRSAARGGGGARYDDPEDLSLQDRCIAWPSTGPPMMPTVYNNNVEIVQTPDYVVLVTEMIHNARIVPLHGSMHDPTPTMHGDPLGHWEGDTLVVETTSFDGRLSFRGSGPGLRLTERFTPTADGGLEYRFIVDDPATWTSPWTVRIDMGPADGVMFEFGCHEGNARSIEGILGGARYEEQHR